MRNGYFLKKIRLIPHQFLQLNLYSQSRIFALYDESATVYDWPQRNTIIWVKGNVYCFEISKQAKQKAKKKEQHDITNDKSPVH